MFKNIQKTLEIDLNYFKFPNKLHSTNIIIEQLQEKGCCSSPFCVEV